MMSPLSFLFIILRLVIFFNILLIFLLKDMELYFQLLFLDFYVKLYLLEHTFEKRCLLWKFHLEIYL